MQEKQNVRCCLKETALRTKLPLFKLERQRLTVNFCFGSEVLVRFFIFYLYGDLLVELNISNQVVIFCSMKGKAWHVHAILFFTYAPLQAYQSRHFFKKKYFWNSYG